MVNGVEMTINEMAAIPPYTVKKISVIHTPKGKYSSQGIRYVVEIAIKREDGILVNVRNLLIAAPENARDCIANIQPRIHTEYTKGKLSLNAGYVFGAINWNYHNTFTKAFPDNNGLHRLGYDGYSDEHNSLNTHYAYARTTISFGESHNLSAIASYGSNEFLG